MELQLKYKNFLLMNKYLNLHHIQIIEKENRMTQLFMLLLKL